MAAIDGQFTQRDATRYDGTRLQLVLPGDYRRFETVASSPPAISNISPSPGTILRDRTIGLRVTDSLGLAVVAILADYASGKSAVIFDGSTFQPGFTVGSSRSPITGGHDYALAEDGGWFDSFTLRTVAVNTSGAVASTNAALAYTVSNPAMDVAAPTVTNISPAAGTPIGRLDPLFFDVTDASALGLAIITARFADGTYEVVHDGTGFAAGYAAQSTRVAISGGFSYRVRRTAGWPSGPTISVRAVDAEGNTT